MRQDMDKDNIQKKVDFILQDSKTFAEYFDRMNDFRGMLNKEEQYTLMEILEAIPLKEQTKRSI